MKFWLQVIGILIGWHLALWIIEFNGWSITRILLLIICFGVFSIYRKVNVMSKTKVQ
jgi:hypothetical protein